MKVVHSVQLLYLFPPRCFELLFPIFLQAAGGIAAGDSIRYTLIKECQEEASIPESLAKHAVSAGAVRSVVFSPKYWYTMYTVVTVSTHL
jgi:hypothetical protein